MGLVGGTVGEVGRGTLSCLTLVRSVRILAIINKEGLEAFTEPASVLLSLRSSGASISGLHRDWYAWDMATRHRAA